LKREEEEEEGRKREPSQERGREGVPLERACNVGECREGFDGQFKGSS